MSHWMKMKYDLSHSLWSFHCKSWIQLVQWPECYWQHLGTLLHSWKLHTYMIFINNESKSKRTFNEPWNIIPITISKLFQAIQKLNKFLGRPVVVKRRKVSVVHELVTVMRPVLANLHPGSETFWTKDDSRLQTLDPDEAGLVNVLSTSCTFKLHTEVHRCHFVREEKEGPADITSEKLKIIRVEVAAQTVQVKSQG